MFAVLLGVVDCGCYDGVGLLVLLLFGYFPNLLAGLVWFVFVVLWFWVFGLF